MKKLRYLRTNETGVWTYSVLALERQLSELGVEGVDNQPSFLGRLLARGVAKAGLVRNRRNVADAIYFAALMGPAEYRLFPISYYANVTVYCYDCWPSNYARWEALLRRNRIRLAFFSARQSAAYFAQRIPEMISLWMPEATDPHDYDGAQPLQSRNIDVLEMGRRYDLYHQAITEALREKGRTHLYEPVKGQIIFPTRDALISGLASSKVSICFPGSLTSPARCGHVETLTHRYLESFASKCIVLGRCPEELKDLFGYNPVIEADLNNAIEQLDYLLSHLSEFEELTEKNYRRLLEVGTWEVRARAIIETSLQDKK
jgi:hypothetical protein